MGNELPANDDASSQPASNDEPAPEIGETETYVHSHPGEESDDLPPDIHHWDEMICGPRMFKWPGDKRLIPPALGGFQLQSLKAWGGFGGIFEAIQTSLDRTVAVKVVVAESEEARELARNEALVLSEVHHSHLLPFFDSGEHKTTDGRVLLWFAMRLVPGVSMKAVIDFSRQVADASLLGSLASAADQCVEKTNGVAG